MTFSLLCHPWWTTLSLLRIWFDRDSLMCWLSPLIQKELDLIHTTRWRHMCYIVVMVVRSWLALFVGVGASGCCAQVGNGTRWLAKTAQSTGELVHVLLNGYSFNICRGVVGFLLHLFWKISGFLCTSFGVWALYLSLMLSDGGYGHAHCVYLYVGVVLWDLHATLVCVI